MAEELFEELCFEGIVPAGWTPQSRRHFCNKSASALVYHVEIMKIFQ